MTFNPDADVSGSRARKRGRSVAVAGGVGAVGLGGLAILLLQMFTGADLTAFLGDGGTAPSAQESTIEGCATGADANANDECRLAAAYPALDGYWSGEVDGYRGPELIIVDGSTPTACGTASNATGPFYCPPEETIYIDPAFFGVLRQQFGDDAGPLAQLYVLAHEWGHHIQQITGIMDRYPPNGTGPASNGVRVELQADCFAGSWVGAMTEQTDVNGVPYLRTPTDAQLRDALEAAATVGDDNIQAQSSGRVHPETWTHGSSQQRQQWFAAGYDGGVGVCDTFVGGAP
ncbi:neutral zinc metallopeptidase [Microbacterium sp.]|uniref:KPN_02809 family neutral zinc metallopeptidase n=1 Tax=Microbacterium sp. TaxID=51671 RepID=UPI003A8B7FD1